MEPDLPHQLIEELGLLLSPGDIVSARATCRIWRTHLSQRVSAPPSGGLFQLCALCEQDTGQWEQRVASLATIFPNVKEFEVWVGARVSSAALAHQLSTLGDAVHQLSRLDLRFLLPPAWAGTGSTWLAVGPDGTAPPIPAPPATLHQLPACVGAMSRLAKLYLEVGAALSADELSSLPPSLTNLRVSADDPEHGLTDASLQGLSGLKGLRHLSASVQPYCISATGLRALPSTLEHLALHGCVRPGTAEVQALCGALPALRAVSLDTPSDAHNTAAMLLAQHPALQALSLALDQDEADADIPIGAVLSSCLAATSGHSTPAASPPASYTHASGAAAMAAMWSAPHNSSATGSGSNSIGNVVNGASQGTGAWSIQPGVAGTTFPSTAASSPPVARLFSHLMLGTSPPPPGLGGGGFSGSSVRACLASLTLQSFSITPVDRGFLCVLAQLRGLHALTIAEPLAHCGVEGDLCVLSTLTSLRTLCISLMPGAPVPALNVTDDVVEMLAARCPHLSSLTALAAVPPDLDMAALGRMSALQSLSLRPISSTARATRGLAARGAGSSGIMSTAGSGVGGAIAAAAIAVGSSGAHANEESSAGNHGSSSRQSPPLTPVLDVAHLPPSLTALSLAMIDVAAPGDLRAGCHPPCAASLKTLSLHQCELGLLHIGQATALPTSEAAAGGISGTGVAATEGQRQGGLAQHSLSPEPANSVTEQQPCEYPQHGNVVCALHATTSLTALALHEVEGVGDGLVASLLPRLAHLTSLHVLPPAAPHPPLSMGSMGGCSALTALKRLSWATWGEGISDVEPQAVRELARGARTLHVLRLPHGQAPDVCAQTAAVVQEFLPLCSLLG